MSICFAVRMIMPQTSCGAPVDLGAITDDWDEVTCPACLETMPTGSDDEEPKPGEYRCQRTSAGSTQWE